jgi:hypothetical protein
MCGKYFLGEGILVIFFTILLLGMFTTKRLNGTVSTHRQFQVNLETTQILLLKCCFLSHALQSMRDGDSTWFVEQLK